jgi:hypothetical protein
MDNYFQECPPMMDDGRLFTDYRSSQVREELFRYKNCLVSENDARTYRIEKGNELMDGEWDHLRKTRSCFNSKNCFHKNLTTRVTSAYNNAELLAYNGDLPAPKCNVGCYDFRLTATPGGLRPRNGCVTKTKDAEYAGYPADRCPRRCAKTNRLLPDNLYTIDGVY